MQGSHFPIFMNLENRKIVIVGAGKIASRRIEVLLNFNAKIKVIAPQINSAIQDRENELEILCKEYEENDINGAIFVIAATNDRLINQKVYEDAVGKNILVNVADHKDQCDFYFPAVFTNEDIVGGMISKNGSNHKLVKETMQRIRNMLQSKELKDESDSGR